MVPIYPGLDINFEAISDIFRAAQVIGRINEAHGTKNGGPVSLGANCMGVVSRPGMYDTWFIPHEKQPKDRTASFHRSAFISQSGAFMLHRSSHCPELALAYMVSMGNQTDLTLGDIEKCRCVRSYPVCLLEKVAQWQQ